MSKSIIQIKLKFGMEDIPLVRSRTPGGVCGHAIPVLQPPGTKLLSPTVSRSTLCLSKYHAYVCIKA